jgi:hypothetical protein
MMGQMMGWIKGKLHDILYNIRSFIKDKPLKVTTMEKRRREGKLGKHIR